MHHTVICAQAVSLILLVTQIMYYLLSLQKMQQGQFSDTATNRRAAVQVQFTRPMIMYVDLGGKANFGMSNAANPEPAKPELRC